MNELKKILLCLSIIFLVLYGCGGKRKSQGYLIGIDPTWYPVDVAQREKNVLAFSIELLQEIAKKENLQLSIVSMNWNNLLWGLDEKKYDAILASLYPYTFYQKRFNFSDLYLPTGPIVIVPISSKVDDMKDLKGKIVGVVKGTLASLILQKYPTVILRDFDSIPETLNALESAEIDAAILDALTAQNYVRDLYSNTLKIATPPLNDQGLRLITLYEKKPILVNKFDAGLQHFKRSGKYEELLKKWGLSPDSKPTAELDKEIDLFLQNVKL